MTYSIFITENCRGKFLRQIFPQKFSAGLFPAEIFRGNFPRGFFPQKFSAEISRGKVAAGIFPAGNSRGILDPRIRYISPKFEGENSWQKNERKSNIPTITSYNYWHFLLSTWSILAFFCVGLIFTHKQFHAQFH